MLNDFIRSRLSYENSVSKYIGVTDNDAEVVNRVLYNHRTIVETDLEKPVLLSNTDLPDGEKIATDSNDDA